MRQAGLPCCALKGSAVFPVYVYVPHVAGVQWAQALGRRPPGRHRSTLWSSIVRLRGACGPQSCGCECVCVCVLRERVVQSLIFASRWKRARRARPALHGCAMRLLQSGIAQFLDPAMAAMANNFCLASRAWRACWGRCLWHSKRRRLTLLNHFKHLAPEKEEPGVRCSAGVQKGTRGWLQACKHADGRGVEGETPRNRSLGEITELEFGEHAAEVQEFSVVLDAELMGCCFEAPLRTVHGVSSGLEALRLLTKRYARRTPMTKRAQLEAIITKRPSKRMSGVESNL